MYYLTRYLIVYVSWNDFRIRIPYFTISRYYQDINVNIAKKLIYPSIRGTLLPSIDMQYKGGWAINWLWIRLKYIPNHKNQFWY